MIARQSLVIRDGWYLNGDIARMNNLGYITITGRISRFSKIAGKLDFTELKKMAAELAAETE